MTNTNNLTTALENLRADLAAITKGTTMPTRPTMTLAPHVVDALTDPTHEFHPHRDQVIAVARPEVTDEDELDDWDGISLPGYTGTRLDEITDEDLHDWVGYDSSDIHQRTAEWEAQARPPVIQHYTPSRQLITDTQRQHANAALEHVAPGVQLGEHLRQHKAHQILADYLGVEDADRILADA